MSRLAAAPALPAVLPRLGLSARLSNHLARVREGYAASARLSGVSAEVLRDTGASAETLTGESAHQEALPFFLQASFGRMDR